MIFAVLSTAWIIQTGIRLQILELQKTFSVEDFRKNKVLNKKALQEELGLEKEYKNDDDRNDLTALQIKKGFDLCRFTLWMNFVRTRFRSLCFGTG